MSNKKPKQRKPASPKQRAQQEYFRMSGNTARTRQVLYVLKDYYLRQKNRVAADWIQEAIIAVEFSSSYLSEAFLAAKERIDNETK